MHAPHVFADAGERLPERRIDDPADEIEHDRQHSERVEVISVPVEIVVKDA